MKEFIKSMLSDERGSISSKRFVGLLCSICLCFVMIVSAFTKRTITPPNVIVESITALAFGCLGLSSVDKIWGKKGDTNV
jgi:hypothetical protein